MAKTKTITKPENYVVVDQADLNLILACITTEQKKWAAGISEAYWRLQQATPMPSR